VEQQQIVEGGLAGLVKTRFQPGNRRMIFTGCLILFNRPGKNKN
jgi:hypothetical protein